ncbi:MAG: DMT family transporter [Anaerovoracaceae bacterium]|nr:DMT family transporter [Anaerovoracaceae bacterium]
MKNRKLIGVLAMVGATLCYGLVPSLSFMAFETGVVSETILFNKFFYAAILMWAYIFLRRIPFKLNRTQIAPMIVVVLAYAGIAITLYLSFEYISGSLATIISFTYPAMVIVVEMLRGRERVRFLKILAVILSMIGLCLIVWAPDMEIRMLGVIFAVLCAVCYTFYAIGLSHPSLSDVNSLVTAGYVMVTSAVINFVRCIFSGDPMFTETADQLMFVLILSVVNAFLAILLFCLGVKMIGPSNASIINTAEPVCACIFGYLLIGDAITASMVIGGLMVVSAVLLTNLPEKSPPETLDHVKNE